MTGEEHSLIDYRMSRAHEAISHIDTLISDFD
jgi:hypothetical protein